MLPEGTALAVTGQTTTRSGALKITGKVMPLVGPGAEWLSLLGINCQGRRTIVRHLPQGTSLTNCPPAPFMYGVRGGKCNVCGGPIWKASIRWSDVLGGYRCLSNSHTQEAPGLTCHYCLLAPSFEKVFTTITQQWNFERFEDEYDGAEIGRDELTRILGHAPEPTTNAHLIFGIAALKTIANTTPTRIHKVYSEISFSGTYHALRWDPNWAEAMVNTLTDEEVVRIVDRMFRFRHAVDNRYAWLRLVTSCPGAADNDDCHPYDNPMTN